MALDPETIEQHEFSSSLRGFDKQEVRMFLARVARDMRSLQAEVEAKATLVTAPPPRPAATSALSDEDRFGELGDRIANLLRNAHDSAAQIKENAEAEVADLKANVDAELAQAYADLDRAKAEAEEQRAMAKADALEIRKQAEEEGRAALEARQAELEATERAIENDQQQALAELAQAREQVADLLEQARAQSEFIRLEADDIIREKIREQMHNAEGRLNVLRNTEEISRDRIRLAQQELESALGRLAEEPAPGLPAGTEDVVLGEAERRAINAGFVVGENEVDADDDVFDRPLGADVIETSAVASGTTGHEASFVAAPATETAPADNTYGDDSFGVDTADADAAVPSEEPVFGTKDHNPVTSPLSSHDVEEDALTRLVRDAMQTAVESARGTD